MDIPADQLSGKQAYQLMVSCIIPRPIAWVSTRSAEGKLNLAPFSYFMGVGSRPPMLAVAIGERGGRPKDTAANIRATAEFVVSITPRALAEKMVQSSADYPPEVDEFAAAGLTPAVSARVGCPGVAESPVRMECRLHGIVTPGTNPIHLVIGEVVHFHVDDRILTDGRPDARKLDPVARLGGLEYAALGEIFTLPRPEA